MNKYVIVGSQIIDENAVKQFEAAMELDWVVKGALMPDAHLGYSLPIGGVAVARAKIVPAWVGYDIGCGVSLIKTTFPRATVEKLAKDIFDNIYDNIPVGFNHRKEPMSLTELDYWNGLTLTGREIMEQKGGAYQLGTLGGGNHFIEIGANGRNEVAIIVHSGSRGFGHGIATHYMKEAAFLHTGKYKAKEGHYPLELHSELGKDYAMDMKYAGAFSQLNRDLIMNDVIKIMQSLISTQYGEMQGTRINKKHNFAEILGDYAIHRKGATSSRLDEPGVIPGSMSSGVVVVKGLGNEATLNSSSHGAGRTGSRTEAKKLMDIKEFAFLMEKRGIVAKCDESTLDENPYAYKDLDQVMWLQRKSVKEVDRFTPILNVKG